MYMMYFICVEAKLLIFWLKYKSPPVRNREKDFH